MFGLRKLRRPAAQKLISGKHDTEVVRNPFSLFIRVGEKTEFPRLDAPCGRTYYSTPAKSRTSVVNLQFIYTIVHRSRQLSGAVLPKFLFPWDFFWSTVRTTEPAGEPCSSGNLRGTHSASEIGKRETADNGDSRSIAVSSESGNERRLADSRHLRHARDSISMYYRVSLCVAECNNVLCCAESQ